MRIISVTKTGGDVSSALEATVTEMNRELKNVDGVISKTESDISAGPSGASVTITTAVNGSEPRRKEVIGINEKGASREHSMRKAVQKMNEMIGDKDGYISDIYTKTIVTPLPGRVYTTIIASVNEEVLEKAIDANTRRERIRKIVELLNNDPSAINVAKVAEVFSVSRTMIYKDLEALGFKRAILKEEEA
jgi:hypothetical protein